MALEQLEPILYLPDDLPFFAAEGDDTHGLRVGWRAVALVVLVFAVYVPVYGWGGFVWQDDWRITQNVLLWGWGGLGRAWTVPIGGIYRPLGQTLFWVERHFGGQSPKMYHLIGVLLHGINAGLLWMVLRRLGIAGAWLAAALFAVHPMQVQAVAWISQQPHLLASAFLLGSTWAFLAVYRIQPLPADVVEADWQSFDAQIEPLPVRLLWILSMVLAIGAALSDTLGLTLPIVLFLLLWWKRPRLERSDWLGLLPYVAIAVGALVFMVVMSRSTAESAGLAQQLGVVQRVLVACRAVWAYLLGIIVPYPLLFVYPTWDVTFGSWWVYVFPPALVLLGAAVCWAWRWVGKAPAAAFFVYLALLLPGLWTVVGVAAPGVFIADHLQYLAAAVPLAAIGYGVVKLAGVFSHQWISRGLRVGLAAPVVVLLAVMAWRQGGIYDQPASGWINTLAYDPNTPLARAQYAMLLLHQDNAYEATRVLRGGERPSDDDNATLLLAWAQVLSAENQDQQAIECYRKAQKLLPNNQEVLLGLAAAYGKARQFDEALEAYRKAAERNPNDESIYNNMGQILASQNRLPEAIAQYDKALKINPRFSLAMINKATALASMHRLLDAAEQLQNAVKVDPTNFVPYLDAAAIQGQIGDFRGAEENCHHAVQISPKSPEPWYYLGLSQFSQKRYREAIANFEQAIKLRSDYPAARKALQQAEMKLAE
jgi:tetratricopeptide (TPR) repeat protein